jgi:hypothetical protein
VACEFETEHQKTSLGRRFQGGSCALPHPGLKPWAVLSDHFMVIGRNGTTAILIPTENPE